MISFLIEKKKSIKYICQCTMIMKNKCMSCILAKMLQI